MASMLDCKKVQPRISEFVDGGMDGDTAWAIKLHLASCAVCSRVAEELVQTARILRELPEMDLSANFEAMLARRLADQVLQPKRPSIFSRFSEWWTQPQLRPAFAAVAALAAVVPISFVVAYRSGETATAARRTASIHQTAALPATDAGLDELWNEHISYASSEPLADSGGILQAQSNAAGSDGAAAAAVSPDIAGDHDL